MERLDATLDKFTNPTTGSLHAAVFIAVDHSGNPFPFFLKHKASTVVFSSYRIVGYHMLNG